MLKREITFELPTTKPKYSNASDYLLLLEIVANEEEGLESSEELIPAKWVDGQWWVTCDSYVRPDAEYGNHGEVLHPMLYELFEEGFFKLLGWRAVWGGSGSDD